MSQRGERVTPATARRHRPFNFEFMEAKYWPHRGGRYGKATSQLGHRPNPACVNCHLLPAPYGEDPPSLRVPRRRSAQPDPPLTISSKLPPYKVNYSTSHFLPFVLFFSYFTLSGSLSSFYCSSIRSLRSTYLAGAYHGSSPKIRSGMRGTRLVHGPELFGRPGQARFAYFAPDRCPLPFFKIN